jgi:hypothetical protein
MIKFEKIRIPTEEVDYREVARIMRINIDLLKKELTDHVDSELRRFEQSLDEFYKEDEWEDR